MSTFTLTRSEAVAVDAGLRYTSGAGLCANYEERDDCYAAIRRLQLEATIRDAGDWWHWDSPSMLEQDARHGGPAVPEAFTLAAEGLSPMIELLPSFLDRIEEDLKHYRAERDDNADTSAFCREEAAGWCVDLEARREALRGLASRFGVEIPQPVV